MSDESDGERLKRIRQDCADRNVAGYTVEHHFGRADVLWLLARLEGAEKREQWWNTGVPTDDRDLIIYTTAQTVETGRYDFVMAHWLDHNGDDVEVAAWRELPAPPSANEKTPTSAGAGGADEV